MTEEQRMEEGRRMFQIFAARMFEQRVLAAYRERVAQERQNKLLEELARLRTQLDELTTSRLKIEKGMALAPSAPGIGVEWDIDKVKAKSLAEFTQTIGAPR